MPNIDPNVLDRLQLVAGQMRLLEKCLSNISNRIKMAHEEYFKLEAQLSTAANGGMTWSEFRNKVMAFKGTPWIQVVTDDAATLVSRYKDMLVLTDIPEPKRHDSDRRQYRDPMPDPEKMAPKRPNTPAPTFTGNPLGSSRKT